MISIEVELLFKLTGLPVREMSFHLGGLSDWILLYIRMHATFLSIYTGINESMNSCMKEKQIRPLWL